MKPYTFILPLVVIWVASGTFLDGRENCPANTRPNIILLLTDDQGYGDIGRHGHPILKTPNMDRLHDESVRMTDFSVSPTCAPTRAAIMTGMQELNSGVSHTIRPCSDKFLPVDFHSRFHF